jgi:hypothetical protein
MYNTYSRLTEIHRQHTPRARTGPPCHSVTRNAEAVRREVVARGGGVGATLSNCTAVVRTRSLDGKAKVEATSGSCAPCRRRWRASRLGSREARRWGSAAAPVEAAAPVPRRHAGTGKSSVGPPRVQRDVTP